jgi:hypothetical protein
VTTIFVLILEGYASQIVLLLRAARIASELEPVCAVTVAADGSLIRSEVIEPSTSELARVAARSKNPAMSAAKHDIHRYLQVGREAVLWKLDGLSEYDVRRPLVPTGTNLLGLVKHLASVEFGYFGDCFGRPHGETLPWSSDAAEPNADMWATADESRDDIVALYRRAAKHADATIEALDLDTPGRVPWWGPHGDVTLHRVLIHVTTETHRHAGHADIVRELIDGSAGLLPGRENLPELDQPWWAAYRAEVERAARHFEDRSPGAASTDPP